MVGTVIHHLDLQVRIPWGDVGSLHIRIYRVSTPRMGTRYGRPLQEMEDGKGRVKYIHNKVDFFFY